MFELPKQDVSTFWDDKTRWGRHLLVTDGTRAWWAREDLAGGEPVIYSIATMAQEGLAKGTMCMKPCSACDDTEALHEVSDYICRNCRLVDA